MKKDLASVLSVLNYNGQISIRRRAFGQTAYIGGGYSSDVSIRYGAYQIEQTIVMNDILVIYVV